MSKLFFKEYFHFTKGERIGTIVLLVLIAVILLLTFLLPGFIKSEKVDFSDFEKEIEAFNKTNPEDIANNLPGSFINSENIEPELFSFNPNEITKEDLSRLGLDARVVNTWQKYREKGGYFRKKEDVKKIYGLTDSAYIILAPYILLPDNIQQKKPEVKKPGDIKADQLTLPASTALIEFNKETVSSLSIRYFHFKLSKNTFTGIKNTTTNKNILVKKPDDISRKTSNPELISFS